MFGNKPKQLDPMLRYVDPTGELPNRELRMAEWYITHKTLLRHISIWCLTIVSVVSISYSLFGWGSYLLFGYNDDVAMLRSQAISFQNFSAIQNLYSPTPFGVGKSMIFQSVPGRYDLSTKVKNPNKQFAAFITYQYSYANGQTEKKEDIILPNDTRPVVVFGEKMSEFPRDAHLVILSTHWRRVDPHVVSDVAGYINERAQWVVDSFEFKQADGVPANQISFDVTNASAYSYWQPVFYVELLNGDEVVGIQYLSLDQFRAGEKRHVDVRSLAESLMVTDVRVYPVNNVFNSDIFMSPGA